MATLTYDPSSADQPEFNEAEQEALAIGEAHAAEEQQLLAGKFEDAEALEQAYIELQKKLGVKNEDDDVPDLQEGEDEVRMQEEGDDEEEVSPAQERIAQASEEWEQNGSLSDETIAELQELPSEELIAAYLNSQQNQAPESADFTDAEVSTIQNDVGGPEEYGQIMSWAQDSLAPELIQSYNSLIDKGDPLQVRLALAGLQAAFNDANGSEGELLTGRGAVDKADVFRSQAEVVEAMSDPRYDRDPAYRQDVFAKLERSDIQY